jgi:hypothetical protein
MLSVGWRVGARYDDVVTARGRKSGKNSIGTNAHQAGRRRFGKKNKVDIQCL